MNNSISMYAFLVNRRLEQILANCQGISLQTAIKGAIAFTKLDCASNSDYLSESFKQRFLQDLK